MVEPLGELQSAVMQILWEHGQCNVAEVHEYLSQNREIAYTTVATVLRRMEARAIVSHEVHGRTFVYTALLDERTAGNSLVGTLLDTMFRGKASRLVNHLLDREEVDPVELQEIKRLISEHEKRKRSKNR